MRNAIAFCTMRACRRDRDAVSAGQRGGVTDRSRRTSANGERAHVGGRCVWSARWPM